MKHLIANQLKEIGLKVTPQRQAVLAFLNGNKDHPSAEDIYGELLKQFPGMSFATVYNTLSKLSEASKIQELNIDPQRTRFDSCTDPHHHFYCKVCGKVFDFKNTASNIVDNDLLRTTHIKGHRIDTVQVNLRGTCKDCRTQ
jgi:Fur family peroxide stress response transcriptional regulator